MEFVVRRKWPTGSYAARRRKTKICLLGFGNQERVYGTSESGEDVQSESVDESLRKLTSEKRKEIGN